MPLTKITNTGVTGITIDSSSRVLLPNVVSWFVNKTSTQTASGDGELITWQNVTLNQGSGFNTSGGNANKFVAPVHGVYTTSGTFLTENDASLHDVMLKKNSSQLLRFRNAQVDGYETYGFTWVGEMDANDTLYLEINTSGKKVYGDTSSYGWTSWCGHLIG